jgi:hypothetical protein
MLETSSPAVILFMTHFIDGTIIDQYRKLRREAGPGHDVVLLYNTTERLSGQVPDDVHVVTFEERDLRKLPYSGRKRSISSYNIELFVLNFWCRFPQYEHYWVMEYDVRFSGDWGLVFQAFQGNEADLLSTTIYRYEYNPDWANWPSLSPPSGVVLRTDQKIASFLPFYRISAKALATLHAAYIEGWSGHCECTVPTILGLAGHTIEDIGGDGDFVNPANINRFYRNTPKTRTKGPGTMVFRPVREVAGEEPDMLWHPVKCAAGMVTSRRQKVLRRARILLKNVLSAQSA